MTEHRKIPIISDEVNWVVQGRRVRQLTLAELLQYELARKGKADFAGKVIESEGVFFLDLGPFVPD